MKTAAIYCRVSTEIQEQEGTSLQTQFEGCIEYCQKKGYNPVHHFKEAWSGLSLERPELDNLRKLVRDHTVEVVLVNSLDRLSRDPVHSVILMQEMEKNKVALEAVNETVDTSEIGKLIFYIKGYAAKLDAERRKDATNRGKQARLNEGLMPQGDGKGIFGYVWDKESKKRVIKESEAEVVRKIFAMIADGHSRFDVARHLNEVNIPTKLGNKWHPLTINRILTNESYSGNTYFRKTIREGKKVKPAPMEKRVHLPNVTPAIVSQEQFERAKLVLSVTKDLRFGRKGNEYMLRGHIKCAICGKFLVGTCLNRKFRYYQCSGARETSIRGKICTGGYIRAETVEEAVWNKVREVVEHRNVILADLKRRVENQRNGAGNGLERDIKKAQKDIFEFEAREKRLIKLFSQGIDEEPVMNELVNIKTDKQINGNRLAQLMKLRDQTVNLAVAEKQLKDFTDKIQCCLSSCNLQTKQLALDTLNVQVLANPIHCDVTYKVPLDLLTIERTSGCTLSWTYSYTADSKQSKLGMLISVIK